MLEVIDPEENERKDMVDRMVIYSMHVCLILNVYRHMILLFSDELHDEMFHNI